MASIEVKDASGKKVNDTELSAAVFGIEPNVHVMHEVVRSQRAARRAGTHAPRPVVRFVVAARSLGARRALAVLVRVRFVLHNGLVAVPYSVLILVLMPSRFLQRLLSWLCVLLCPQSLLMANSL